MSKLKNTDILIVGSGLSGLSLALMLPESLKITIITKSKLNECSTAWAQGGIASVLSKNDSLIKHENDTLKNGHHLNNLDVVKEIIKEGPDCIKWLTDNEVQFTKKRNEINLTLEGGHSERRIAHINDETGNILHKDLSKLVKSKNNIKIIEDAQIIDLIYGEIKFKKVCLGAYIFQRNTNTIHTINCSNLILATGGASKIYQFTTNPNTSTGDGIAAAWRAGCTISNMEFIQFHPTCLYHPSIKSFLISESMRGEGAKLLTPNLEPFMSNYDSRKELAPRDIVARAIDNEMKTYGYNHVFLDISHKSSKYIKKRFPTIYNKCLSVGIDITQQPIPVIPASHYTCGGVKTNISGETEISNLYVIGEASCTGFHGANRLASNSLLECIVMAKKCSASIQNNFSLNNENLITNLPQWDDSYVTESKENFIVSHNWDELRKIMWNYVGIVRSEKNLHIALEKINLIENEVTEYYQKYIISSDLLELRNIIHISKLIIQSALLRKESRGLHYSKDYPKMNDKFSDDTNILGRKNEYHLKLVKFKV